MAPYFVEIICEFPDLASGWSLRFQGSLPFLLYFWVPFCLISYLRSLIRWDRGLFLLKGFFILRNNM